MDAIAFLIGIVLLVVTSAAVAGYALTLHHIRALKQQRIDEYANQSKFQLMNKALDKNMLPPGRWMDN